MKLEDLPSFDGQDPIITGTGIIALDVIMKDNTTFNIKLNAGGSCGNVLTILSFLGWKSYPIAHLMLDNASKILIQDMSKWGVDTSLILHDEAGRTPIIVEVIKQGKKKGHPTHRFSWTCPDCGSYLPRFKAMPKRNTQELINNLPKSNVFYFDRATSSSIDIAESLKKRGSLIYFEPNGVKDKKQFLECLALADIIKYSHLATRRFHDLLKEIDSPLVIETLGAKGLKFRYYKKDNMFNWTTLCAFNIDQLKDAAGAGDWCSAGIIHALCRSGIDSFKKFDETDIEKAIKYGQALSAINCQFEGARGAMYNLSKNDLLNVVYDLWNENKKIKSMNSCNDERNVNSMIQVCPECIRRMK